MSKKYIFFIFVGSIFLLCSCVNSKSVVYFNNIQEGVITTFENLDLPIQKSDVISVYITSLNPEATAVFNAQNDARVVSAQSAGYLVNADGTIQLPIIGNIKAEGLTKKQLSEQISNILTEKRLLIDPIVTIRHLNFKVTVLGEVNRPTVIPVPNEKITLLEAIGLAGDLTIYGKRDNVLLIREREYGKKQIFRINLNNDQLFKSEFYYLHPNDIIYVEPGPTKVASLSQTRLWLPTILGTLSLLANIYRFTR